jgi:tripartite-type tricarboxylate transporter receptor subunit TctC
MFVREVGRLLAAIAVSLALVLTGAHMASAESKYPDKPVRIILPFGPGGVADVTMRLVAQKLSDKLGQNFFIDNRPGAGGIVSAKAVLSYPADGYTLYFTGNGSAISESLFKSLPFNITRDFTSVSLLAGFDMLLVTQSNSQVDSVQKLVAFAKANPGKLNFGTISRGSTQNLSAELFKLVTGVSATVVVFRTTPDLITAIMRGEIDVGFDYYAAFRSMLVAEKIKVIATSGDHPAPGVSGVPTVKDSGYPEYVVTSWNGLSAPTGTPADIVARLNQEIIAILKTPDIESRMAELGMEPMVEAPEAMTQRMESDIAKWAKVIDAAKIEKQ